MEWIGIRKKLSYDEVKTIISDLGISLPDDYCKVIGPINGGALQSAVINVPGIGDIPYSRNLSLVYANKGNAIDIYRILLKQGKKIFPFGTVGNGDYYCFDLEKTGVVLYLHEKDEIVRLCKTYSELISRLTYI